MFGGKAETVDETPAQAQERHARRSLKLNQERLDEAKAEVVEWEERVERARKEVVYWSRLVLLEEDNAG